MGRSQDGVLPLRGDRLRCSLDMSSGLQLSLSRFLSGMMRL
jgi:hypothetical protein